MTKYLHYLSIGFVALLALVSCKPEPYLSVDINSLAFDAGGGSSVVHVTANYPWTASVNGPGFVATPNSGEGDGSITVYASEASSPDETTGTLTIMSEGLSAKVDIKQSAKPTLTVKESNITVNAEGGPLIIETQYNVGYTASVAADAQSWIKVVKTKGLSSGQLELSIERNTTYDSRVGVVTITADDSKVKPYTITITQEQPWFITPEQNVVDVPATGGAVTVHVFYTTFFTVFVEEEAKDWIHYVNTKDSMYSNLEFDITPNRTSETRSGVVTLKSNYGKADPATITFVQPGDPDQPDKEANLEISMSVLRDLYDALDGDNWDFQGGTPWFSNDDPFVWKGVHMNSNNEVKRLLLENFGLKGEIPESIGKLSGLEMLIIQEEGVTGTLPASMGNLTKLEDLRIRNTSMTSLADIFNEKMASLKYIEINNNRQMTGPVPEGLAKLPAIVVVDLGFNDFTGTPAECLAPLKIRLYDNRLSGPISDEFFKDYESYTNLIGQQEGYGFDLSKYDLAGGFPLVKIPDIISGEDIDFPKIISENKYTVYLFWAPWCPISKNLMPQLVKFYNKYHRDGLEIVATVSISDKIDQQGNNKQWDDIEGQIKDINEKGYGLWYNFYYPEFVSIDLAVHPYFGRSWCFASTPQAEIYDSKGNIVFSARQCSDPVRDRFNKNASGNLIPFLESLFGPLEEDDDYESTDYSQDGEVLTLQKATKGNGIDIVLMGDGYTDRDMGKGGLYETVMSQSMEELFAIEPYKSFRDRFNVYAVKVVSKNNIADGKHRTAFGSAFVFGSSQTGHEQLAYEYAAKAVSSTDNILVSILVNSTNGGGITSMNEQKQSSVAWSSSCSNDHDAFGFVLRHEAAGHGFGFLGDEYVTAYGFTVPDESVQYYTKMWNDYGWFANVDFTSDPTKTKWADLYAIDEYKEEAGAIEGGLNVEFGVYRPTYRSVMNDDMGTFNAPSRRAIYKRIMELSGEGYSFEKFLEYDVINRVGAAKAAARPPLKAAAHTAPRHFEHTPPQIVMQ